MTDNEITLVEYVRAVRKDWRLVASIVGVAAILSIIIALMLPERFKAEAGIVPTENKGASAGSAAMLSQFGGIAGLAGIDLGALGGGADNASAILKSRMLVDEFIRRNDLLPALFEESVDEATVWLGVRYFREEVLSIREDVTTAVTYVTIEWKDPVVAAGWANGLVALTNEIVREQDRARAERNIAFLNEEIARTDVFELKQVLYGLIETEMQTVMLANANPDYAFTVVDPAVAPELRSFPHRSLLVVIGTVLGGFLALVVVLIRELLRREDA